MGSVLTFSAQAEFSDYIESIKNEAQEQGFDRPFLDAAFADVKYIERAVKADKNQPERKITLDSYLASRVPQWKVNQAIDKYKQHEALLQRVGQHYGVQPRFIVALWGNESNFGRIQGKFPLLSSLSTLAFDGRREAFFKKQLFAALTILKQGHITQDKLLGSWAGAMGQSQFMPTSFLHYAQDFDGDGKKDIWSNEADVFASIANFLKNEGWDDTRTWGRQVRLPDQFDTALIGLGKEKAKSLSQWQMLGVRRYSGELLPSVDIQAHIIAPDGKKGRIYLVYNNFQTLMRWNRSSYFGVSVSYLSEKIKEGI